MAMDKTRYPKNWNEISKARRAAAGWKCEWCGLPNGAMILRKKKSAEYILYDVAADRHYDQSGRMIRLSEMPSWAATVKYTRVVLTVHHIGVPKPDGTPGSPHDKMDVRPENLAALCQRCHFLADLESHIANARISRRNKRKAKILNSGQKELGL